MWMDQQRVDFYFETFRPGTMFPFDVVIFVIEYPSEVLGRLLHAHPELREELRGRPAKNSWERDLQLFIRQLLCAT